eukprot:UN25488
MKDFRNKIKEKKVDNSKCLWWTDDNEPKILNGYSDKHLIGGFPGMEQALTKVSHKGMFNGLDWFPECFVLPTEQKEFEETIKNLKADSFWIMKPPDAYGGRGIHVYKSNTPELQTILDKPPLKQFVVQKYMGNPILLGGYKFHIRAYCTITSLDPLRAY